jgi:hypothetical protein
VTSNGDRRRSAAVLERALTRFRGALTVADAAARSGLPLRDAEEGLRALAADLGGHLAATSKGELVYSFPRGLVRPPERRLSRRAARALARAARGAGRFVVRAWVSVVFVGYAAVFLALAIAWSLRSEDDSPSVAIHLVLRALAEALFWTFHPFSPVYVGHEPRWLHPHDGRRRAQPKLPFYERVNRFVFGPPPAETDPRDEERRLLAEIRRCKGRIGAGDVMRVTGLPREDAERRLLRLVVDYDGEIEVSDEGALVYRFSGLRTTAAAGVQGLQGVRGPNDDERRLAPAPVWSEAAALRPLTGNGGGTNVAFSLVNGFNLAASGFALAEGLTLERVGALVARAGERAAEVPLPPADGLPLALGLVPFAFSLLLFALPLGRALRRPAERRRVAHENGWRALLRLTLSERGRPELEEEELRRAWRQATGRDPKEAELRAAVQRAGGEPDLREDGRMIYRFEALAREQAALEAQRRAASADEAHAGEVVFSSADALPPGR